MVKCHFDSTHKKLLKWGLLFLVVAGIFSCESSDQLGLEIAPPGERFAYHIDSSSTVSMETLRQDSLTSEKRSAVLLGSTVDDVFGSHQASFLSQFRLSSNDVDFGVGIQLDSVILLLKYHGHFGDTSSLQNVKVFEMTDDLEFDSVYYSNLALDTYFDPGNPVADLSYYPTPSEDSLSIRLADQVGLKILEADTSHLIDNDTFLEYFKGLYIMSDPVSSSGSMSYFNLAEGKSRMILYYSNNEEDSLSYEVVINSSATWVNIFDHQYDGSEAGSVINDSTYSHDLVYIQAMSGLRAGLKIEFSDNIMLMAKKGIAINKAELVFPVELDYITGNRPKPSALSIFGVKEDGTNAFIDDIFLGEAYYDGGFHIEDQAYIFNIARHVQNILDPDVDSRIDNSGLFLVINESRVSANSLVLKNGNPLTGVRLNITYTLVD